MNREIKFRAWINYDGFHGEMINGCQAWGENHIDWNANDELSPTHESTILMQYTGLKDKNGVEIYEGDIIPNKTHGNLIVEYDDNSAAFYLWKDKQNLLGFPIHFSAKSELEVIGNIYENPELLKQ